MTKPGKHGTLRRYSIRYTDGGPDSGCPEFTWRCWAYDLEHAQMKFEEGEDADGWKILGIDPVMER